MIAAALHAAQQPSILVAVDEGARLRPVARHDGTRWAITCAAPARRDAGVVSPGAPRILVSGGAAVEAVRRVQTGSAEWRNLEPVVKELFETRERQENVSAAALESVPLAIDAIFTPTRASTPQIYYFRSSKTIPDSRGDVDADDDGEVDPKGDLRIDVTGWLQSAGVVTSLGTNAMLSWEQVQDRPEGVETRRSTITPIGLVRLGDTRVWVLQGRAGEITWYTLYDVGGKGVHMLVRTESRGC